MLDKEHTVGKRNVSTPDAERKDTNTSENSKITYENFYKNTKATFDQVERPEGEPDYVSHPFTPETGTDDSKVSSEYWYGNDIRLEEPAGWQEVENLTREAFLSNRGKTNSVRLRYPAPKWPCNLYIFTNYSQLPSVLSL